MNIRITGHARGLGRSLYEHFKSLGHNVEGFSLSTVSSGAVPGQLIIATTPDNGSTLKFVVLDKDGNFGINVTNPTKKLEVNGNGEFASEVLLGRMDQTAINGLTAANGMIVYNTTTNKFQGYEGGAWSNLI